MGYPENYGAGQEMYVVSGTKGNISGQLVQMRGNLFGKGTSGGAWMAENKYLIGLNSFRVQGDFDSLWGPLFDEKTEELFEEAIKG